VPVGTYTVTAELAGFKKFVKTGVQLSAAINIRVDGDLEVGTIPKQWKFRRQPTKSRRKL
jgi:hypothetical protein